jgi:hypothetical protein
MAVDYGSAQECDQTKRVKTKYLIVGMQGRSMGRQRRKAVLLRQCTYTNRKRHFDGLYHLHIRALMRSPSFDLMTLLRLYECRIYDKRLADL